MVYDDVVTRESVTTPEQIKKVTAAWELSLNLGSRGGKQRYIGTRYHQNDTYKTMMDRGSVIPRIKPATDNGKMTGKPVFLSQKEFEKKRRDMGPYTFGTQMLQDPVADKSMGFKTEWLKYYEFLDDISGWNLYLTVDPASKKKKGSDYTVFEVNGFAPDGNIYFIEGIRDRLNLTERAEKTFYFHQKYDLKAVGYEEYGLQADIEHIEYEMEQRNYRFEITKLGGTMAKEDRIKKLIPVFEQKRYYMPKQSRFVDYQGVSKDYTELFIKEEFESFPVSTHDDMFDCKARILDPALGAVHPKIKPKKPKRNNFAGRPGSWMG